MSNNQEPKKRGRVSQELHYMKLGAKVLPKVVGKKIKGFVKTKIDEARERATIEREADTTARKAELEAYRVETIRQVQLRGTRKGQQRAAQGSGGGILQQLGDAGKRMSVGDTLGFTLPQGKGQGQGMGIDTSSYILGGRSQQTGHKETFRSAGDYIFSGMGQQQRHKRKHHGRR